MRNIKGTLAVSLFLLVLCAVFFGEGSAWATPFEYSRIYLVQMPKQIHFARENGDPYTGTKGLHIKGKETVDVYVDVKDYGDNGLLVDDYFTEQMMVSASVDISADVKPSEEDLRLNSPDIAAAIDVAFARAMRENGFRFFREYEDSLSVKDHGDEAVDIPPLRRHLTKLTVSAKQPDGFERKTTQVQYTIYFGPRVDNAEDIPKKAVVYKQAAPLFVTIDPYDDGGANADNGGGSCNALALGTASLLVPGLLLLRRRKG